MHGGSLYSLADTVAGTLADYLGCDVTTVEGSLNFLEAAADIEYVYCEARIVKSGRHLITVNVLITDGNEKTFDCGYFTFFRMTGSSSTR